MLLMLHAVHKVLKVLQGFKIFLSIYVFFWHQPLILGIFTTSGITVFPGEEMHYYLNHSNQTKGYATSAMRKIRKKNSKRLCFI